MEGGKQKIGRRILMGDPPRMQPFLETIRRGRVILIYNLEKVLRNTTTTFWFTNTGLTGSNPVSGSNIFQRSFYCYSLNENVLRWSDPTFSSPAARVKQMSKDGSVSAATNYGLKDRGSILA
jgi:hypothetical protein